MEHLFKEGVMCVKKDPRAHKHNELEDIPNLHVMMVLRSLASRSYLSETFSWQWHYYMLTDEDINNLHIMMVLRSLATRSYLSERFSWRWHCYMLTEEGINYL